MHEASSDVQRERKHHQRVAVRGAPGEVEIEAAERRHQRAHDDALQPVGTAGDVVELVGQLVEDGGDAERHHQPRQVGAAQDEQAGDGAEHGAGTNGYGEADERIGHGVLGEQRRRVGAEAEERGVAKRDDAGIAEDEVERDREQGDDGDLVEQQRTARQQQPRQRQCREQRQLPPAPARLGSQCQRGGRRCASGSVAHRPLAFANKPCGRSVRMAIIRL